MLTDDIISDQSDLFMTKYGQGPLYSVPANSQLTVIEQKMWGGDVNKNLRKHDVSKYREVYLEAVQHGGYVTTMSAGYPLLDEIMLIPPL